MVLNHIAAIIFFSGPLFYIGLVMVLDPAGIAALPELFGDALTKFQRAAGGRQTRERPVKPKQTNASREVGRNLRLAGLALVICGLLFAVVL